MQRLLSVGLGYLQFAFIGLGISMLSLYFIALAIKDTKTFLIVAVIGVLGFLVYRNERKWHLKSKHRSAEQKDEPEDYKMIAASLAELLAVADAANIVLSPSVQAEIKVAEAVFLYLTEWTIQTGRSKDAGAFVKNALRAKSKEFERQGFYIVFASEKSLDVVSHSITSQPFVSFVIGPQRPKSEGPRVTVILLPRDQASIGRGSLLFPPMLAASMTINRITVVQARWPLTMQPSKT